MWLGQLLNVLMGRALLHNDDHVVYLLFVSVGGDIAVCHGGNGYKKSPSSTKRDERQTVPRYHPHSAHHNAPHFFGYRIYPIPVTEEIRQRLIRIGFQRRSSGGNFIVPASASVSSHAGHSLKAALGTITFLCHRFVQYLCLLYRWTGELSMTNLTWFDGKMHKFSYILTSPWPSARQADV